MAYRVDLQRVGLKIPTLAQVSLAAMACRVSIRTVWLAALWWASPASQVRPV